jgi:hypothetical protein
MIKKRPYQPPIPMMQIRKNALIFFSQSQSARYNQSNTFFSPTYAGHSTIGVKKRIKRTVDILCQLSPPRTVTNPATQRKVKHSLSFITLTIPAKETHIEPDFGNKNLLAPFIRIMKKKFHMITYIWKAEFQKNNQLHYHLTTPSVIHYSYIRDTWGNILSSNKLLVQWYAAGHDRHPPCTDIRSVYKQKDMQWYLSKEISKAVQNKKCKGKIWDCSLNIKGIKFFSTIEPSNLAGIVDPKKLIPCESCTIYRHSDVWRIMPLKVKEQYTSWRLAIVGNGMY